MYRRIRAVAVLALALAGCSMVPGIPYWDEHATYSAGDLVQIHARGGIINTAIYVSKGDGNTGHYPPGWSDWWMY